MKTVRQIIRNGLHHTTNEGHEVTIVEITPPLAAHWLTTRQENRSISQRVVEKYARDMTAGEWTMSNAMIVFDSDDRLIDGEHRLRAIVLSETPIRSVVMRQATTEDRRNFDSNIVRVKSHQWAITKEFPGVTNHSHLQAFATAAITGPRHRIRVDSYSELTGFVHRHLPALKFAMECLPSGGRTPGVNSGPIGGLITRAWYHIDADTLSQFCYSLREGTNVAEDQNAVMRLRDILTRPDNTRVKSPRERYQKAQTALSAYVNREKRNHLKGTTVDLFPIMDPLVD